MSGPAINPFNPSGRNVNATFLNPGTIPPGGQLSQSPVANLFQRATPGGGLSLTPDNLGAPQLELPELPINKVIFPKHWQSGFQDYVFSGDLLLVVTDKIMAEVYSPMLTVAQYQWFARTCYETLEMTYAARLQANGVRGQFQVADDVLDLWGRVKSEGDEAAHENRAQIKKIETHANYDIIRWCIPFYLHRFLAKLGLMINTGNVNKTNNVGLTRANTVHMGKGGYYQPTWNIWGAVAQNDSLHLVIRRDLDKSGRAVGYCKMVPVVTNPRNPKLSEFLSYDYAGIQSPSIVFTFGQVYRPREQIPSREQINIKTGLTADYAAAAAQKLPVLYLQITEDPLLKMGF